MKKEEDHLILQRYVFLKYVEMEYLIIVNNVMIVIHYRVMDVLMIAKRRTVRIKIKKEEELRTQVKCVNKKCGDGILDIGE